MIAGIKGERYEKVINIIMILSGFEKFIFQEIVQVIVCR